MVPSFCTSFMGVMDVELSLSLRRLIALRLCCFYISLEPNCFFLTKFKLFGTKPYTSVDFGHSPLLFFSLSRLVGTWREHNKHFYITKDFWPALFRTHLLKSHFANKYFFSLHNPEGCTTNYM